MASQCSSTACDPFAAELDRLQNMLKDKDRELEQSYAEVKALKATERGKEKALEEMTLRLQKLEEKLKANGELLESKNLEIKKLDEEKKAAMATQQAAESTLRRVYTEQPDEDLVPFEAILAPYEAEMRSLKHQISVLQEDNKALERVSRSKEAALLEAEKTVQASLSKAESVEELQNRNHQLSRQLDIFQEENKILDKMHRQKVNEVEKLSRTINQLEEAILARGAVVNAIYDYERQLCELMEEKKTLKRELSRAKVAENRLASSAAFDRSEENEKLIPLKVWLDERRVMQGEMQQLREKLALAERTAKAESQLKEKLRTRLKVLEKVLRALKARNTGDNGGETGDNRSQDSFRQSFPLSKRSFSSSFSSSCNGSFETRMSSGGFHLRTNSEDQKSIDNQTNSVENSKNLSSEAQTDVADHTKSILSSSNSDASLHDNCDDTVSGVLYDMLQKEVVFLKKACGEKEKTMKDKNDLIETLSRKVETLKKAMEAEAKKMRRELAAKDKELVALKHHHNFHGKNNTTASDSNQRADSFSKGLKREVLGRKQTKRQPGCCAPS